MSLTASLPTCALRARRTAAPARTPAVPRAVACCSGAPARVQAPGRTAARRPGSLLWSGARGSCSRAHSTTASLPPTPVVTIDNLSDPLATIVEISYGDLLGELLDTIQSLKNLGLDITRAVISEGNEGKNRFYITDAKTSEKIVLSERLEEIRAVIINNMLTYHPESRDSLAAGRRPSSGAEKVLGTRAQSLIPTTISIKSDASGARSALKLLTTDRPGLLVDVVKVLKDCSLNVVSANINTKGLAAEDTFFITYQGKALNANMDQLVMNALQYYLTMAELEKDESY